MLAGDDIIKTLISLPVRESITCTFRLNLDICYHVIETKALKESGKIEIKRLRVNN